jgi:hypothetical protein
MNELKAKGNWPLSGKRRLSASTIPTASSPAATRGPERRRRESAVDSRTPPRKTAATGLARAQAAAEQSAAALQPRCRQRRVSSPIATPEREGELAADQKADGADAEPERRPMG